MEIPVKVNNINENTIQICVGPQSEEYIRTMLKLMITIPIPVTPTLNELNYQFFYHLSNKYNGKGADFQIPVANPSFQPIVFGVVQSSNPNLIFTNWNNNWNPPGSATPFNVKNEFSKKFLISR